MLKLQYLLKEAVSYFKNDIRTNIIYILSITIPLILCGVYLIIIINLTAVTETVKNKFEIIVFLDDRLSNDAAFKLKEQIEKDDYVAEVIYTSKERALSQFREELGDDKKQILDNITGNPLPASFNIKLHHEFVNHRTIQNFATRLYTLTGVEEIYYGEEWLVKFDEIKYTIWVASISVGCMLIILAVILLTCKIKLILSRRRETYKLMKLIGATDSFISIPVSIEGCIIGTISGIISIGVLYLCYHLVRPKIMQLLFLSPEHAGGLILSGILTGWIVSTILVRYS